MPRPITHGHGTRACYMRGCGRAECRAANAAYMADRREREREAAEKKSKRKKRTDA